MAFRLIVNFVLFSIIVFLLYLIINIGLSNFFTGKRYSDTDSDTLNQASTWSSSNPYFFEKLALQAVNDKNYSQAESYLLNALALDPTNGRAVSLLAMIYDQRKNVETQQAFDYANKLWPAFSKVRMLSANYHLKDKQYSKVMEDWHVLLTRAPNTRKQLFPIVAQMILAKETQHIFGAYLNNPPKWWIPFFHYLAKQEEGRELIGYLYTQRLKTDTPILEEERKIYVNLLIKNKQWSNAYFSWLGGIGTDIKYAKNYMFDGGFESDLIRTGFSWNYLANKKIFRISRDAIPGMSGRKTLHVSFLRDDRVNFQHIWQRLMLSSGSYKVSFRVRLDNLRTNKGLTWRLRCLDDKKILLGESSVLNGSSLWVEKHFEVVVPDNCQAQILKLEAASQFAHDQVFKGQIWFDDFIIQKLGSVTDE